MTETEHITPDRLAAIEAELERLRAQHERAEEVKLLQSRPSEVPEPKEGFAAEGLKRQRALREARERVRAEWAAAYEEQLERVQPEVEQLQAKRAALTARADEETRRAAAKVAKVRAEADRARREIDKLMTPPPMPAEPALPPEPLPAGARPGVPLEATRSF